MRSLYLRRVQGGQSIQDYDATVGEALRLSGPKFMNVFQLDREPAERRRSYGGGFGRPAKFDGGSGRGHYSKAFSVVLAGGGLKNGRTIGVTDELGMKIESHPVSIPDLHATMYNALGIDPTVELHTSDDRPVPITDGGRPIRELFV